METQKCFKKKKTKSLQITSWITCSKQQTAQNNSKATHNGDTKMLQKEKDKESQLLLWGAWKRLSKILVDAVIPTPQLAAVAACKKPLPSPTVPFSRHGQYNCFKGLNTWNPHPESQSPRPSMASNYELSSNTKMWTFIATSGWIMREYLN
jgi:hypothetical protein